MKPRQNFDGVQFNNLLVVHDIPSERGERKVMCQCRCGNMKPVTLAKLKSGHTKSCGRSCRFSANHKHGMTGTRFYTVWENMINRTRNLEDKNYGGRGIKVCTEWLNFLNFKRDMFDSYAEGLSLERKDVEQGYSLDNCVWATQTTQTHNRRKFTGNCKFYGVHWNERDKRFIVAIAKHGQRCRIYFQTEEDAAKGYDDASEILYGDRPNKTSPYDDDVLEKVKQRLIHRKMIKETTQLKEKQ